MIFCCPSAEPGQARGERGDRAWGQAPARSASRNGDKRGEKEGTALGDKRGEKEGTALWDKRGEREGTALGGEQRVLMLIAEILKYFGVQHEYFSLPHATKSVRT
jgi:hypothetical protein